MRGATLHYSCQRHGQGPMLLHIHTRMLLSDRYNTKYLTLSPPITTNVPYANSLDQDETPSNSLPHPGPSCLTFRQFVHQL